MVARIVAKWRVFFHRFLSGVDHIGVDESHQRMIFNGKIVAGGCYGFLHNLHACNGFLMILSMISAFQFLHWDYKKEPIFCVRCEAFNMFIARCVVDMTECKAN